MPIFPSGPEGSSVFHYTIFGTFPPPRKLPQRVGRIAFRPGFCYNKSDLIHPQERQVPPWHRSSFWAAERQGLPLRWLPPRPTLQPASQCWSATPVRAKSSLPPATDAAIWTTGILRLPAILLQTPPHWFPCWQRWMPLHLWNGSARWGFTPAPTRPGGCTPIPIRRRTSLGCWNATLQTTVCSCAPAAP